MAQKRTESRADQILDIVGAMPQTKEAGLPTSARKLRPKYDEWKEHGFASLVSKKFGNTNRLKVTGDIETLVLSLYNTDKKPYATDVLDSYILFMEGKRQLVDESTGELICPTSYMQDGKPVELSKTTVWNIINNPVNRITVDKLRMSKLEFNGKHRPHVMRHAPSYSFSKITMDDLAIPFKMEDGKRAWAYQIWDVTSGCVIGKAFARSNEEGSGKNRELFKAAMNDMFRNIVLNGWGMPAEIEVEQHISNTFKGSYNEAGEFMPDLLSEGYLFPFVRFCNPSNPQEKRAEHNIKGKKYQFQNKREGFQRRPFSKLEANRLNEDKNKVRYSFESVVANEEADIRAWNNSLHHNQDKYPGLTRWGVLQQCQNPNLAKPHLPTIARYIGGCTTTSIKRTFVQVQHAKYIIPTAIINSDRLNSTTLTAYYLHNKTGHIPEVYIYQNNEFVCTALKTNAFNESRAERTEEDEQIMHKQMGHISAFDKMVKDRVQSLKKIAIVQPYQDAHNTYQTLPHEFEQELIPLDDSFEETQTDYWTKKAFEDL